MSGWRLLPQALLATALGACAHPALGEGPSASFRAVETQHFTLYTDLDAADADYQGRRLEQLLFALQQTGWESTGDLPLRMNVVMFAYESDFKRFAREDVGGFAIPQELFEPWMVLPAPRFGDDYAVVAHELTHAMSYQAIMHMPNWLSEGLASYFESAHFQTDGSFELGAVSRARFNWLRLGWDLPSQLLAQPELKTDWRFYSSSWLLVHFLMTRHADEFVTFQDQLARGETVSDAWLRAFSSLPREALDQAVQDYARAGAYESFVFELESPADVRVRTRRLSLADEHALLALLWRHCHGCPSEQRGRSRRELERALQLEPDNVWAVVLSIRQQLEDPRARLARARALVRTHPDNWLSWMALGASAVHNQAELVGLSRDPEMDPGARAARLAPRQPYALAMQAVTAALRGEREVAVALIETAQRLQPTDSDLIMLRVLVLLVLSSCNDAATALALATENVHAEVDPKAYRELRSQLEVCREGQPWDAVSPPSTPPAEAQPPQ